MPDQTSTRCVASIDGTAESPPLPGWNILVVEDNADFRELLCEMLLMLEHKVFSVASAEEALVTVDNEKIDVLISDVRLPGMSGLELATRLHTSHPQIKIILSSGYGDSVAAGLHFDVAVLSKPYSLRQLTKALLVPGR